MSHKLHESIDSLLQVIDEAKNTIAAQDKELDRLRTESLENSIAIQVAREHCKNQKVVIDSLILHLSKMLDEVEGRYDSDEKWDSHEFCKDYADAAKFLHSYAGRKFNRVAQAEEFLKGLPY